MTGDVPGPIHSALVAHLRQHSVRIGDFVLKSGRRSSWFIDSKQTACRPDGVLLVADAFLAVLGDDVDAIGGLTMGADPVAFGVAAVAAARGRHLRSFSVRKEAKDHGGGGRIAGALQPGDLAARGRRRGAGVRGRAGVGGAPRRPGRDVRGVVRRAGHRLPGPRHRPRSRLRVRGGLRPTGRRSPRCGPGQSRGRAVSGGRVGGRRRRSRPRRWSGVAPWPAHTAWPARRAWPAAGRAHRGHRTPPRR